MKDFINDNFLLENKFAEQLYHDFAKDLPIIDYHNHLPPKEIATDKRFDNLTQVWLNGDHYKWRAMRAFGINEKYITGAAADKDKFIKWAETVPNTLRNPLYHWTQLELKRYFGINELLDKDNAESIYHQTAEILQTDDYSVIGLLQKMKVEVVCTTDDPLDSLEYHKAIQEKNIGIRVLPTFRPDKAMDVSNSSFFKDYLNRLGNLVDTEITSFEQYLEAIAKRHDYFHKMGCRLSDHGLNHLEYASSKCVNLDQIFNKLLKGEPLQQQEQSLFQATCSLELAKMDHQKGWVQQFHLGALRNNNERMLRELGPDTGFDSIGDFPQAQNLSRFLNTLDNTSQLAKTILYNLNPADNEVFAAMIGNFNDGTVRGKMQWGAAWWFLDQMDGMEKQINTLSNMGLLSCFVGMLTDSRSFLSFPRHEYFRRLLCSILGRDMEKGLIPTDMKLVGGMVEQICYYNAKVYFGF